MSVISCFSLECSFLNSSNKFLLNRNLANLNTTLLRSSLLLFYSEICIWGSQRVVFWTGYISYLIGLSLIKLINNPWIQQQLTYKDIRSIRVPSMYHDIQSNPKLSWFCPPPFNCSAFPHNNPYEKHLTMEQVISHHKSTIKGSREVDKSRNKISLKEIKKNREQNKEGRREFLKTNNGERQRMEKSKKEPVLRNVSMNMNRQNGERCFSELKTLYHPHPGQRVENQPTYFIHNRVTHHNQNNSSINCNNSYRGNVNVVTQRMNSTQPNIVPPWHNPPPSRPVCNPPPNQHRPKFVSFHQPPVKIQPPCSFPATVIQQKESISNLLVSSSRDDTCTILKSVQFTLSTTQSNQNIIMIKDIDIIQEIEIAKCLNFPQSPVNFPEGFRKAQSLEDQEQEQEQLSVVINNGLGEGPRTERKSNDRLDLQLNTNHRILETDRRSTEFP